jgi:RHS repeat-associated protein
MNKTGNAMKKPAVLALALAMASAAQAQTVRTEATTYEDNTNAWVLGQVKSTSTFDPAQGAWVEVSRSDYDAVTAQPIRHYAFGQLQQTVTYGSDGTIATASDGRDSPTFDTTITLSLWKRGIPREIAFPDATKRRAEVDDYGLIEWVADETKAQTCYLYDAMGRLARVTYPTEGVDFLCDDAEDKWNRTFLTFVQVQSAEYGLPAGHWRQRVSTGNGIKEVYFDAMWRPVVEASFDDGNKAATLSEVVKRYDVDGRVVFQSYPMQGVSSYATVSQGTRTTYDALDRATRVEQDSEHGVLVSTTDYLAGFQTRATSPRGLQTTTSYETFDQPSVDAPTLIQHPENVVTEIQRDSFGNPTLLRRRSADNSLIVDRQYLYDALGRLCKTVEPETASTVTDYDAAGNVLWSGAGLALPTMGGPSQCASDRTAALSSGRAATRTYDNRNRLSTLTFPDHRGDQSWTYTADGLPSQIITDGGDGIVVNAYHYNARRMLDGQGETLEQQGWYTWGFGSGHDKNGHLVRHVYPGGETVEYAPNALGQATQVVSSFANYATNLAYYPNGALQRFTYGNGIVHEMTRNARGLPERSLDAYGGTAVVDDSYDYDFNGNVAAISDGLPGARGNRTMGYDGLDRLSWVVSPMFGTANYWYDAVDNLTHVAVGGPKARDHYYCYDSNWRLTNIKTGSCSGASVTGLGYDVQGNLQNKNGRTFNFDYGNRLRTIADGATMVEAYRYDGHGRRILQWHPSGNILSMYGTDGVLRYQESGRTNKATNYIYLAGSLIATKTQTTWLNDHKVEYQHTDALGTPVVVTDAARNVIERSEYEPYGQLLNRPIKDGPGYTGHVSDAMSGLTYMQQRYYEPTVGRFLSVDPVTADWNSGAHFNRYWYAANNPYRFIDPDGRVETLKSCNEDNTCMTAEQADQLIASNGRTLMAFVAAPALAGGTAGLAVESGAAGAVGNAIRDAAPKVARAVADTAQGVAEKASTATSRVVTQVSATIEAEIEMAMTAAQISPTTVSTFAAFFSDPDNLVELGAGAIEGLSGTDTPPTSAPNALGSALGGAVRDWWENL